MRGPERVLFYLFAAVNALTADVAAAFRGYHLVIAGLTATAAVLVHLLARWLGCGRVASLLIAFASVLGPWIVFGTALLNGSIAGAALVAMGLAACRAADAPSAGRDVLVLASVVFLVFLRTPLAPLAAGVVAVLLVGAWRASDAGSPLRRLARLPLVLVRRHVVLCVLGAAGLLVFAVASSGSRNVYRDVGLTPDVGSIADYAVGWSALLLLGTLLVPGLLGIAWAFGQLRGREPRSQFTAVFLLVSFAGFVYTSGAGAAQFEERYVALFGPLVLALGCIALARREVGVIATAVCAALGAWAVLDRDGRVAPEAGGWFVGPARGSFANARGALESLPLIGPSVSGVLLVTVAGAAAVSLAALTQTQRSERSASRAVAVALPMVLLVTLVSAVYSMGQLRPEVRAQPTVAQEAWIDPLVGDESVISWDFGPLSTGAVREFARNSATLFNASTCCAVVAGTAPALLAGNSGRDLPDPMDRDRPGRFVLRPDAYAPLVFETRLVRLRAYGPGYAMRLETPRGPFPVRASGRIFGPRSDGTIPAGRRMRVENLTSRRLCVDVGRTAGPGRLAARTAEVPARGAASLRARGGAVQVGPVLETRC